MASKQNTSIDARNELAELVKRKAEIAVSILNFKVISVIKDIKI